jgi:hypothetical protein
MRSVTSAAHRQNKLTPESLCPWLRTMTIDTPVDVSSALYTLTPTYAGVSDEARKATYVSIMRVNPLAAVCRGHGGEGREHARLRMG